MEDIRTIKNTKTTSTFADKLETLIKSPKNSAKN